MQAIKWVFFLLGAAICLFGLCALGYQFGFAWFDDVIGDLNFGVNGFSLDPANLDMAQGVIIALAGLTVLLISIPKEN